MAEPLRATFFALEKRERGGVLIGAMVCYLLCAAALTAALIVPLLAVMGLDLQDAFTGAASQTSTPPDPMKALWIVPLSFVVAFAFCVLAASFEAACLRWMIRGEKPGLFGLTLDADTWRVYGIYWIWLLFYVVAWIGFLILSALVGRLFPENQIALWVVLALYACLIALGAVALAPAAAVTVAERRFAFSDAVQASEDHFSSLLGSFAVLIGGQWVMNYGLIAAWLVWTLGGELFERFAGVSDYVSFNVAYGEAVVSGMSEPGAAQVYWVITAASFVASFVVSVLIYGVNARVALLAKQEGRIGAASAPA
jgi:hypothetical protein